MSTTKTLRPPSEVTNGKSVTRQNATNATAPPTSKPSCRRVRRCTSPARSGSSGVTATPPDEARQTRTDDPCVAVARCRATR